ncbi:MAG: VCBS repeat-containing protein, partial [Spirochaetes bacterium]|nr:VCBS repeat-containing protein [Spirochaetota bacterium]
MKKLLNKIQRNSTRVLALIILEIFIMTLVPVPAIAQGNGNGNTKGNDNGIAKTIKNYIYGLINSAHLKHDEFPLILSYSLDRRKNLILLSWNKDKDSGEKFYVFKKASGNAEYELISDSAGIINSYYIDSLEGNNDAHYIVAQIPELPEVPKWAKIFSFIKINEILESFNTKEIMHLVSNEVRIDINDGVSPLSPALVNYQEAKKEIYLSWRPKDDDVKEYLVFRKSRAKGLNYYRFTTETSFVDRNVPKGLLKSYYVYAFDETGNASIPFIYSKDEEIDGIYIINENEDTVIEYMGVKLEIPVGSVPPDSFISIIPLGIGHLRETSEDAPNITMIDGNYVGYDITLNGDSDNLFFNDIKVSINYDESKIPSYAHEGSVFLYYYDEVMGKWKHLKRESLDKDNNAITSVTNHLCQFYAGTMTISSEPPQAKGINTDPINIQKVDPMAGIKGIAPPTPNNRGTANVSYPIEVPAGINNLTPNVSINYSSDAREGNCGYGWNLGVSKIEIDTKDGVPNYGGNDKLLFDGREIISIGGGVYRFKVEGVFLKIKKTGSYFVVYRTDGSRMYYGENNSSRLYDPGNTSHIFSWYLTRVVDKFGNQVTYEYYRNENNLYLSRINYGYNNAYSVNFNWEDRSDIRINYRSGFVIKYRKRLCSIEKKYKQQLLARNDLNYNVFGINKSLLISIEEKNSSGDVLNKNSFEYSDTEKDWIEKNDWKLPTYFTLRKKSKDRDLGLRLADLNGDGLVDLIQGYNKIGYGESTRVWLNDGKSFVETGDWKPPTYFTLRKDSKDRYLGLRLADLNGDG